MASTVTPSGVSPLPPLERHNESEETLRARLVYQSRKRGTLESDLLLSTFARDFLPTMSVAEMQEYDKVCSGAVRFEYMSNISCCCLIIAFG